jgi:hypothetical protein
MKLSTLLANNNVTSTGFPAIAGLGAFSKGETPVTLSSLPAITLFNQGITEYYTIVVPRGTQFGTTQDIIDFDPDVQHWAINTVDTTGLPVAITTQHKGTLDILSSMYPNAEVISQCNSDGSPRNLSAVDVMGKHVIGVLPPFLVAVAGAFTSASISNFNAVVDGDLTGNELKSRLIIADKAIAVKEIV